MSLVTTDSAHYAAIAGAIRTKLGVETAYKPEDMAAAIASISGGTMLRGTTPPSASLGSDGDYYEQSFPIASGVNFIEYLESSGTQYIDTGIIANQGTDVTCDFYYKGNQFIIGARTGGANDAKKALQLTGYQSNGITIYKTLSQVVAANYGFQSATIGEEIKAYTKTKKEGSKYRSIFVPNTSYNGTSANAFPNYTSDYTQVLFGCHQGSTPSAGTAKIKRVTYYQDGAPIADYLPCLDANNVACMWDNVAREYVYNDGTGDFIAGAALSTPPDELEPALWYKENGAWIVVGW